MEQDNSTQTELKWYERPQEIRKPEEFDKKPELKKALKEKFGNDGKPIHAANIKFLNEGIEREFPDKFGQNDGQPIKKIIIEVEWEGKAYVMFINKSTTEQSLFGQLFRIAKKNKKLTGVNCKLTITGKLGDKSMRYILEEASPASPTLAPMEQKVWDIIKKEGLCHESVIANTLNIMPENANLYLNQLLNKKSVELVNKEGCEYWKVIM